METKIESRTGKINGLTESVYNFLSNFNNFKNLIPPDKVKNWKSTEDSCHFTVDGIGETGIRIIEKQPFSLIKISGEEGSKFNFLWAARAKNWQTG